MPVRGVGDVESDTVKVWLVVPIVPALGVPLIVAVDPAEARVNPAGKEGVTDQV